MNYELCIFNSIQPHIWMVFPEKDVGFPPRFSFTASSTRWMWSGYHCPFRNETRYDQGHLGHPQGRPTWNIQQLPLKTEQLYKSSVMILIYCSGRLVVTLQCLGLHSYILDLGIVCCNPITIVVAIQIQFAPVCPDGQMGCLPNRICLHEMGMSRIEGR